MPTSQDGSDVKLPQKRSLSPQNVIENETHSNKKPAMASIFQNSKTSLKFKWLEPINGTCLHGIYGNPKSSSKIAAFDI
ncbi:hypothetical protein O181_129087, partial [Austropuccinia psidii MF-1]|nr:hypothetical protein [Austropuccinia psidii MF-1]